MEHTITYTVDDGTTYRFQYDNETLPPEPGRPAQMHYLVFEDGLLKLETWHHALPGDLTEDDFRSTVVLGAFFNCLGRTMREIEQKEQLESSPIHAYKQLATLIDPHMRIRGEQAEWVRTVMERHHDAELYVKLAQDAEVERFARQLNGEVDDGITVTITASEPRLISKPSDRPRSWIPPTLWASGVVLVSAIAIFAGKLFGWE